MRKISSKTISGCENSNKDCCPLSNEETVRNILFILEIRNLNAMEDDEDDFFAYQAAKSLNNKRTQLKQFLQT